MEEYNLEPKHDSRKSFYGKAKVTQHQNEDGETIISLYSYNTLVAYIKGDVLKVNGWYSMTTGRHINEFALQNGFNPLGKTDMQRQQEFKRGI